MEVVEMQWGFKKALKQLQFLVYVFSSSDMILIEVTPS